ncbi:MAG: hypothetical protein K2W94_06895 [Alphaproteobacteria bacterium]|nr:hypothetical protein [Alphaproteobacteria bacterium]
MMILKTFIFVLLLLTNLCCAFDEDLQIARAIVDSRIHFYTIRGELLTRTDEISIEFQRSICNQGEGAVHMVPSLAIPGAGDDLMGMLIGMVGRTKESDIGPFLSNAQRLNQTCLAEWGMVLDKIISLQTKGTKEVTINDFTTLMDERFSRRVLAEGSVKAMKSKKKGPKPSDTVLKDLDQIALDFSDFKQIFNLLEPHLLDALAASITGKKSEPDKKSKKQQKKEAAALRASVSTTKATELPEKEAAAATEIIVCEHTLVREETDSKEVLAVDDKGDEDIDESFEFNPHYFRQEYPRVVPTNNPKLARKLAREAAAVAATKETFSSSTREESPLPSLVLKPKHKNILKGILGVSSHPPKWRNAIGALNSIIQQWGGSYNGSLKNGSTTEFWIGNVRFLVDSSHGGSDPEMMYPSQMEFMREGLIRAGITRELLARL